MSHSGRATGNGVPRLRAQAGCSGAGARGGGERGLRRLEITLHPATPCGTPAASPGPQRPTLLGDELRDVQQVAQQRLVALLGVGQAREAVALFGDHQEVDGRLAGWASGGNALRVWVEGGAGVRVCRGVAGAGVCFSGAAPAAGGCEQWAALLRAVSSEAVPHSG